MRDLTWRRCQSHLTRKDTEYLTRGREWLAAEMALASDGEISEANKAIDAALAAGMERARPNQGNSANAIRGRPADGHCTKTQRRPGFP